MTHPVIGGGRPTRLPLFRGKIVSSIAVRIQKEGRFRPFFKDFREKSNSIVVFRFSPA